MAMTFYLRHSSVIVGWLSSSGDHSLVRVVTIVTISHRGNLWFLFVMTWTRRRPCDHDQRQWSMPTTVAILFDHNTSLAMILFDHVHFFHIRANFSSKSTHFKCKLIQVGPTWSCNVSNLVSQSKNLDDGVLYIRNEGSPASYCAPSFLSLG